MAVSAFYRVSVAGETVPPSGPLVLVGNHPNGLVDPILLSYSTERSLRFLGKAPLFQMPLLGMLVRGARVLPVYRAQDGADTKADNEDTFRAVFDALVDGDAVALFPEGKSHSEPKVQRMKTGAARMALGAQERAGADLGIRVVPVGLVYRARRRFRSRAVVWVGAPIAVDDLADEYREDAWSAVEKLTERIKQGLAELTLELERWEELPLLEFVADLEAAPRPADFASIRALAHELSTARERFPDEVIELAQRARRLKDRLAALGAEPSDLTLRYSIGGILRYALRQLAAFLVATPPYLAGLVAWFLPWQLAKLVVRIARPESDTWATTAVLAGMVLFPVWVLLVGLGVGFYTSTTWGLVAAVGTILVGLVALRGPGLWKGLWRDVKLFASSRNRRELFDHARGECDDLVKEIHALRTREA